jgi:hypothetical protein
MKIEKIIFSLLVLAQPAVAQPQFRIQANAAALRTHLSNATDNASDLVSSAPKITPNAGVILSWTDLSKNGFQGMRTGLEYLAYKQTTAGGFLLPNRTLYDSTGLTSSSLQYLSLPLEARFGLKSRKGITLFVTLGGYTSVLLNYKETARQIRGGRLYNPASDFVLNTEVNGKDITYDVMSGIEHDVFKGTLRESIYRPLAFGIAGSLGVDFHFRKRHFFSLRLPVRYGLTDIERKEVLQYASLPLNAANLSPVLYPDNYSYWDTNTPKGLANNPYLPIKEVKRSVTHPFSYGLELSYGFVITPEKAQK